MKQLSELDLPQIDLFDPEHPRERLALDPARVRRVINESLPIAFDAIGERQTGCNELAR